MANIACAQRSTITGRDAAIWNCLCRRSFALEGRIVTEGQLSQVTTQKRICIRKKRVLRVSLSEFLFVELLPYRPFLSRTSFRQWMSHLGFASCVWNATSLHSPAMMSRRIFFPKLSCDSLKRLGVASVD